MTMSPFEESTAVDQRPEPPMSTKPLLQIAPQAGPPLVLDVALVVVELDALEELVEDELLVDELVVDEVVADEEDAPAPVDAVLLDVELVAPPP
jgi:hypothetical protein